MITKVYDKVKQFLIENIRFFTILIVLGVVLTYELHYYIDAPGGLLDVSERIEIEGGYQSEGSFNLAYVSELKATIPTLLIAYFSPSWDILKEEDMLYDNETMKELIFRDKILLEEAISNATIVGYEKAGKKVDINSEKIYISYIDEEAITTLAVGDQILEVEGKTIKSKDDLSEVINTLKAGDEITIKVLADEKEIFRTATIQNIEGKNIVGVLLSQVAQLDTDPTIKFHFTNSESGPSGGLMTALSIYNMLIEDDLTKGHTIVGTGTIDLDGTVGSIGGVKYKLKGAVKKKAEIFFVPAGENYEEAVELKEKNNYKIEIVSISHIDEAIEYLKNL